MSNILDTKGLTEARAKMKSGEFSLALSLMINDLRFFPENLPLRANIASCYYMTENYLQFKRHALELLQSYENQKNNFNPRELRSIKLALVRLLEEIGEISICIKLLAETNYLEIAEYDQIDTALLAQLLRLQSCYSVDAKDRIEIYNHCRFLNTQKNVSYIDLESAMLLADWSHFGESVATDRLMNFLSNEKYLDHQKRLIVFDHLYESLRANRGIHFDLGLLDKFVYLEADSFEKFIWDLTLEKQSKQPNESLKLSRTDTMSTQGAFKVLYLMLTETTEINLKQEISKKMSFLLSGLTQSSRMLILKSFPIIEGATTVELAADHISINGRIVPKQKCKSVHRIFSVLTVEGLCSTDSIIKSISGEGFDANSYAKMRVLVARANSYLFKTSGVVRALSITKESISINSHLQVVYKRSV